MLGKSYQFFLKIIKHLNLTKTEISCWIFLYGYKHVTYFL